MPSAVSHAFLGIAFGAAVSSRKRIWAVSAACSALPDVDALAVKLFSPLSDMWTHRGFSHSLIFAFLVGLLVVSFGFTGRSLQRGSRQWWLFLLFFFATTASHGFADALNNGSIGVDFFAPFSSVRYLLPYRPIPGVGVALFFSLSGQSIFLREILWLWIPAIALTRFYGGIRRRYLTAPVEKGLTG